MMPTVAQNDAPFSDEDKFYFHRVEELLEITGRPKRPFDETYRAEGLPAGQTLSRS